MSNNKLGYTNTSTIFPLFATHMFFPFHPIYPESLFTYHFTVTLPYDATFTLKVKKENTKRESKTNREAKIIQSSGKSVNSCLLLL